MTKAGKPSKRTRSAKATKAVRASRYRRQIESLNEEVETVNRARFEELAASNKTFEKQRREITRLEGLVLERTAERDAARRSADTNERLGSAAIEQLEGWRAYFRETPLGRLVAASESIIDGVLPDAEEA